ncbi:MAG: rRNA maturation RNase YbeY, partial [Actinomycetota bacterium]
DIVICPEVARRQAPEHCGSIEAELALLVIHGVLHILGHDHAEPEETAVMQARERHHLGLLGHRHPGPQAASC